ncbi:MAG: hypothetical protein IIB38_08895 [Candidatus Hydrogenedentes bacterium]|nr:hypothetical protein [Candidatus Hydrogenedentota bacterium]
MKAATINMKALAKDMTLRVKITGLGSFKARLWIGVRLLRLATFVMGIGLSVKIRD